MEDAWGETAVVVCGGKEIVSRTRNCVAALSDERAVHKGDGRAGDIPARGGVCILTRHISMYIVVSSHF